MLLRFIGSDLTSGLIKPTIILCKLIFSALSIYPFHISQGDCDNNKKEKYTKLEARMQHNNSYSERTEVEMTAEVRIWFYLTPQGNNVLWTPDHYSPFTSTRSLLI